MVSIDWKDVCKQFLRLVPFFVFVTLYFCFVRDDSSTALSTCLCFPPIICLMLFVVMKGFKFSNKFQYTHFILIGLGLSCLGNILVSLDLIVVGLVFFALTHIAYASAPLYIEFSKFYKTVVYVVFFVIMLTTYRYLFPYLTLALKIEVPIYGILLVVMAWMGVVYAVEEPGFLSLFCAVGCSLFYTSAVLVGMNVGVGTIPHLRVVVMSLYYAAQCLIALSALCEVTTVSVELTTVSVQPPMESNQMPTNSTQLPIESSRTPT